MRSHCREIECIITYPDGNAWLATVFKDGSVRLAGRRRGWIENNVVVDETREPILAPQQG